jgi:hypothetical protein
MIMYEKLEPAVGQIWSLTLGGAYMHGRREARLIIIRGQRAWFEGLHRPWRLDTLRSHRRACYPVVDEHGRRCEHQVNPHSALTPTVAEQQSAGQLVHMRRQRGHANMSRLVPLKPPRGMDRDEREAWERETKR